MDSELRTTVEKHVSEWFREPVPYIEDTIVALIKQSNLDLLNRLEDGANYYQADISSDQSLVEAIPLIDVVRERERIKREMNNG